MTTRILEAVSLGAVPSFAKSYRTRSADYQLDGKPVIEGLFPDGTIPLKLLNEDLIVVVPTRENGGFVHVPGDVFYVAINGTPLMESASTFTTESPAQMTLIVPKNILQSMEDAHYDITYMVNSGNVYLISGRLRVILDRQAAGGGLLPRIMFDDRRIETDGISAVDMLESPGRKITARIPDYQHKSAGDVINVFARAVSSDHQIAVSTIFVATDSQPLVVDITLDDLSKVEKDGLVDFYFRVTDRATNISPFSPVTTLCSVVKHGPRTLRAARVRSQNEDILLDADIRPRMKIEIPQCEPSASDGDYVLLNIGGREFIAGPLSSDTMTAELAATISVEYVEAWALSPSGTTPAFDAEITYSIVRYDVKSRAPATMRACDFTLPGGRDPDATSLVHEGLALPTLLSEGGRDNVIEVTDIDTETRIIVRPPSGTNSEPLQPGDDIVAFLDASRVAGAESHVQENGGATIKIAAGELLRYAGNRQLTYRVSRKLASGHVAESLSPPQGVSIYTRDMLPGKGVPLKKPMFVLARLDELRPGTYWLITKYLKDPTNRIRIHAYQNMRAGDRVTVQVQGFDDLQGNTHLPSTDFTLSYTVQEADLVARPDVTDPDRKNAVFFDIPVGELGMRLIVITYGVATATYHVSNDAGWVASEPDRVLVRRHGPIEKKDTL